MANKFCHYCGSAMEEHQKFCPSCGKAQAYQETTNYSTGPTYQAPPPTDPYPVYQQGPNYQGQSMQQYLEKDKPLSIGQFIGMFFLTAIPIAGFILLLVWAFNGDTNKNKRSYAGAILIMMLISLGVYITIFLLGGLILRSLL